MIICQTCGTTNNEENSRVCRNCGALLPVSSRSTRGRTHIVSTDSKKAKKTQKTKKKSKQKPIQQEVKKEDQLELEAIPSDTNTVDEELKLNEIPAPITEDLETEAPESTKTSILQEIPVQPFKGSIIGSQKNKTKLPALPTPPPRSQDSISNAFSELKTSILEGQDEYKEIPVSSTPSDSKLSEQSIIKQKQLEKDMTKVLGFLSKKISVKKLEVPKSETEETKELKEEIPPSSMSEILNRLLSLDLNIEASAILKTDGTILASAISSRISDSLFATIGMNLSMIGTDIIEGLDAGTLKSISIKATEGVLDLAPIDKENPQVKDMFLILFSHSKVKSGIISFAINIVKKQLKDYLGFKNSKN